MDDKTKNVLQGYRHKNYARTINVANFARKIVTGEDYGTLVIRYKPRESEEQKEQRVEITQDRTSSVESKTAGFFSKVFRKDKLVNKIKHSQNNVLENISLLTRDYGNDGQSLIVWCEESSLYYNRLDPNVFYWVKYSVKDGVNRFDPVIFPSEDVLDFKLDKGSVKYAVCRMFEVVSYKEGDSMSQISIPIYYYFGEDGLEITIELNTKVLNGSTYYSQFDDKELQREKINQKEYITFIEPYEGEKIPITRIGYKYDPRTNQNSYVTYFDSAVSQFKQLAKIGSEYDLSLTLHTFLQKVQYYTPCKYQHKNSHICRGGKLHPSGDTCPKCQGTGKEIHTSSQDVIEIKLPDGSEEKFISPKDLVYYVDMKMDIVKHQKEEVDEYPKKITETIFGVDISHTPNGNPTAAQIYNQFDQAQDVIYEFTKSPRKMYLFTLDIMVDVLGINDLYYALEYPNEFNLESEEYLLSLLKSAKDSGANPNIIGSIEDRIINKQNRSDSVYIAIYNAIKRFQPFGGVEPSIKEQIILQLPFGDLQKSLYLNFKQITDKIMDEVPEFLALESSKQWEKVKEFAEEYAQQMKESNSPRALGEMIVDNMEELEE
jgi:hypothetical protein